ncbi:type II toxin-antitoxin system VapC family toxin [Frankia sp. Cr2]|uniref:type II toxin-antitoxin system VapC family toxin n=1 Tax=Frankia sp. Cr2 TaxID=3073932 RepID=UPI003A0FD8CA
MKRAPSSLPRTSWPRSTRAGNAGEQSGGRDRLLGADTYVDRSRSDRARVRDLHHNLSAYDAQYVALAETLGLPLITSDARIERSAATKCPVEVFA